MKQSDLVKSLDSTYYAYASDRHKQIQDVVTLRFKQYRDKDTVTPRRRQRLKRSLRRYF
jgi:hypothetical protein